MILLEYVCFNERFNDLFQEFQEFEMSPRFCGSPFTFDVLGTWQAHLDICSLSLLGYVMLNPTKISEKNIPSLKQTCSALKINGWKTTFPFGARPIFRGKSVRFRECSEYRII